MNRRSLVVPVIFSNTINYRKGAENKHGDQIIISKEEIEKALTSLGFVDIIIGGEGKLHINSKTPAPTPFFSDKYYGLTGTFEVIAKKS